MKSVETKNLDVFTVIKKLVLGTGVVVVFIFFASIVKPEISSWLIPKLIDVSESYIESNRGVDLDPIIASSGNGSSISSSIHTTSRSYGKGFSGELVTSDTRVIALNRFLVDYDSPMAPYSELIVESADEVGLDWRLVVAISCVESACGRIIPYNSYNAWGWRGGPGGDYSIFESWNESIPYITTRIAVGYGTDIDIFDMEPTYCPPCGQNPQHAWANGVIGYMEELSNYRQNL